MGDAGAVTGGSKLTRTSAVVAKLIKVGLGFVPLGLSETLVSPPASDTFLGTAVLSA
ncbi:hypothetical protein CCACVL1_22690 [Corchorus capsularis]|uniref:Uncharacterized protein n=1 Tax=Corchorus capsularis TaxID=210143 RepID=A0A1R3GX62_COCAP|nr:hypothetical protein CCACVL1_22690 [Corchorus capsularis]